MMIDRNEEDHIRDTTTSTTDIPNQAYGCYHHLCDRRPRCDNNNTCNEGVPSLLANQNQEDHTTKTIPIPTFIPTITNAISTSTSKPNRPTGHHHIIIDGHDDHIREHRRYRLWYCCRCDQEHYIRKFCRNCRYERCGACGTQIVHVGD